MYISAGGGGQHGKAAVEQIRTVVIYDATTGKVVHTHHAVTFAGGKSLSDDDLKDRALKLARETILRTGRNAPASMESLHVNSASLTPGTEYRVDLKQRSLVPAKSFATSFDSE